MTETMQSMMIPRLDEIGRLVGEPSRAAILDALMDGRAWTGRELARTAHVTPSTASEHLARLVGGDLVGVVAQGRNRYYRIASAEIAQALEALMVLAPQTHRATRPRSSIGADLQDARTCYDHFAGRLGVALADALVERAAIVLESTGSSITPRGFDLLAGLGIALDDESCHRPVCKPCLDWSERRFHVAGRLGAALVRHAFAGGWVNRKPATRAVAVTAIGVGALRDAFGIEWKLESSARVS